MAAAAAEVTPTTTAAADAAAPAGAAAAAPAGPMLFDLPGIRELEDGTKLLAEAKAFLVCVGASLSLPHTPAP